jgi:autotransporter-associated beta strand protein
VPVRTWNGSFSLWSNPANWSGALVPTSVDTAVINSGIAQITSAASAQLVHIGAGGWLTTNANFNVGSSINVGSNGTETGTTRFQISGGTTTAADVLIGIAVGSTGIVNVSGGGILNATNIYVGYSATGRLTVSGATVNGALTVGANGIAGSVFIGGDSSAAAAGTINGNIALSALSSLTFRTTDAATYGGVISGQGSLVVNSPGQIVTLAGINPYTGTTTITAGTLRALNIIGGNTNLNSGDINIAAGATLEFQASASATRRVFNVISGSGDLLVTGGGGNIFTLEGNNSYTGTTTIENVTFYVGQGTAGTLGTGNVILAGGANLRLQRSDTQVISNAISGVGIVQAIGNHTAILTGANSYTGVTSIITDATLQIGNGGTSGSLGTGNVDIALGGELVFKRSDTITVANVITGAGTLIQNGTGVLQLSGVNTYSSYTQISNGTLALIGAGSIANSLQVILSGTGVFDISGIASSSATVNYLAGSSGSQILLGGKRLNVTYAALSLDAVTFVGSAGVDALVINVTAPDFALAGIAGAIFSNWTDGVDIIEIYGNASDNSLIGDEIHATFISGGGGSDMITGGAGNDTLFGDADNDIIAGGAGADIINGGLGADTVSFAGALSGVTINLATNVHGGDALGDSYTAIELFAGSDFTDSFTGDGNDNRFNGGAGITIFTGGAGNDRVTLGTGAAGSSIDGGANTDTLVISANTASLAALSGIEALEFVGGANLTLTGSQFANGLAFATALSGTGSITVNMDAGINFLSQGFAFTGSSVAVTVNGTSGTDIIKCGTGVHTINAGDGVDQIRGGTAADIINGGDGNDKIIGFTGADIITGGAGSDQFRYFFQTDSGIGAANSDQLTDFAIGSDKLNFSLIDADAVAADDQAFAFIGTDAFTNSGVGQIRYINSGADLLVQADVNGDGVADMEIILQGLNGGTLTAGDFIL